MKHFIFLSIVSLSFLYSCSSDEVPGITPVEEEEEMEEELNLEAAPDFTLTALDGGEISLESYQDKVLVIFFFGYACPPCISAGPTLTTEIHEQFSSDENFQMIGIDVWDGNSNQVQGFRDNANAIYPLGLMGSSVASDYGTIRDRLVVINQEGQIVFSGNQIAVNDLEDAISAIRSTL